jgi:hypothetical protein
MDYPEEFSEIDGRIYLQALLIIPQGNNQDLSNVVSILVFDVQYKLRSMLYHRDRFLEIEDHVIKTAIEEGKDKARMPDELFFEFEAFLFQTKSVLDITTKILEHLFKKTFKAGTFGNKGSKLINNLEEYRKKIPKQLANVIDHKEHLQLAIKYRNETIDNLIALIQNDKTIWLGKAIDSRDTISHFRGSSNLSEYAFEENNGKTSVLLPKILDVYPHYFLKNTYCNCIGFIQDFICLFIELWLPPMFAITKADKSNPTFKIWLDQDLAAAKYIKFTLGMREWT